MYRDYARAYIRAVRRRGLAPKVKTKAFMQKLHYYFYSDQAGREYDCDYTVYHHRDWQLWDWKFLNDIIYRRHQSAIAE